jgi:hypothetical protein
MESLRLRWCQLCHFIRCALHQTVHV